MRVAERNSEHELRGGFYEWTSSPNKLRKPSEQCSKSWGLRVFGHSAPLQELSRGNFDIAEKG